jgi:hypothetical protein
MKKLLYLSICALLIACSGQKATESNTSNSPQEWLSFKGKNKKAKHIVMISGDEEYRSEEALPQLAKILSTHHGFKCTVLFSQNPDKPGIIDANFGGNIPGLEALETADMMIIFTRFRALPDNQMKFIDGYLKTGKPVIGMRTATHAFNFGKDSESNFKHYNYNYKGNKTEWEGGFGRFILGETWISHHGHHKHQSSLGIIADGAESHPITNGIVSGDVWGATDVYGVRLPLPEDSQPIILGQVMNRKGAYDESDIFYGMKKLDDDIATTNKKGEKLNNPMMPISWVKSYTVPGGKKGKVFTTTIGVASDMLIEGTRRLLVNAVFWGLDIEVPLKANVDFVGAFNPTAFGFRKNEYWEEKRLKVSDFK